MQKPNLKIIISGGGTGGHIFPAIAIANALKKLVPSIEILFVGAEGRMEMEKVPAAGYNIEGLWISGLQRKLTLGNLWFPLKVISSVTKARRIIKRFKPDAVVGVGGYASGPLLYAATQMGVPALIQEQNSYPGITNKLLAKRVNKICVAYEGMERYFPREKLLLTGNPVRQDIVTMADNKVGGSLEFGLNEDKKTLLVVGGSLGALTINDSILAGLSQIAAAGLQLIWQTGKSFYPKAKAAVDALNNPAIKVFDFITMMDYAYAAADGVISRAGASAISELVLVKKPLILVPSPNVAEDHQTKNALALVICNAAILVKDLEAQGKLVDTALKLLTNEEECKHLQVNIAKLAKHNAAEVIANEVLAMCLKNELK